MIFVGMRSTFSGLSLLTLRRSICHIGIRVIKRDSHLTGFFRVHFSVRRLSALRSSKANIKPRMANESNAFYIVRKGDLIGIFKRLSDCQAQVGSSVCDPPVSVYKGYSLSQETEEYIASQGFKDALFCMHASHLKDDVLGNLVPCPFQQPDGMASMAERGPNVSSSKKRLQETGITGGEDTPSEPQNKALKVVYNVSAQPISIKPRIAGGSITPAEPQNKAPKVVYNVSAQAISTKPMSCILEFDGASKGNPGKAGAGAVLRTDHGDVISHVREGLGTATNNVAEYRALILGMKYALKNGFKHIRVQGDSQLVCLQVQDLWQTKNQNMAELCKEAKRLKEMFQSFNISHIRREFNTFADNLANLAVNLPAGEICEDFGLLS